MPSIPPDFQIALQITQLNRFGPAMNTATSGVPYNNSLRSVTAAGQIISFRGENGVGGLVRDEAEGYKPRLQLSGASV